MNLWLEIVNIAESIHFSDEDDYLIWKLTSYGLCSLPSLLTVVNFRGRGGGVPADRSLSLQEYMFLCGFYLTINYLI